MGEKGQSGFELSLSEDLSLFLVTQEALAKIKARVAADERFFGRDTDSWIDSHVVVIPDFSSKTSDLSFNIDEVVKQKIKQKIQESHSSNGLSQNKGCLVLSGEPFDDQGGVHVISFCWIEKQDDI